jgi:hypothetical protein
MRHPDLPDSDPIEIAESAVPQHGAQGWEVTDPPAKPEPEDEADGGQPRGKSATPAASSTKKKEKD